MLKEPYASTDHLVADYNRLGEDHRADVHEYIKRMLKLQRAEDIAEKKIQAYIKDGIVQPESRNVCCSFCGKPQDVAEMLFAGNDHQYICDSCVDLCVEIMTEKRKKKATEGQSQQSESE